MDRAIHQLASETLCRAVLEAIDRYIVRRLLNALAEPAAQPWVARLLGERNRITSERASVSHLILRLQKEAALAAPGAGAGDKRRAPFDDRA